MKYIQTVLSKMIEQDMRQSISTVEIIICLLIVFQIVILFGLFWKIYKDKISEEESAISSSNKIIRFRIFKCIKQFSNAPPRATK